MMTAKIFENGRSQAVRLPKKYQFDGDEVLVTKVGEIVMLMPKKSKWNGLLQSLDMFTDDYMSERIQPEAEEREEL